MRNATGAIMGERRCIISEIKKSGSAPEQIP
jgi:hypothetical protein